MMCSPSVLAMILAKIGKTAKDIFGNKLCHVYLYGSYARGDQTEDSDVDIMIVADVSAVELYHYKLPFIRLSSELGLENDTVITVTLKDADTFNRYRNAVPFYRNVLNEGVSVAV